jgi:DNA polymerase I-like protein with 3'-5' exonuclease and polymerase domains
LDNCDANVFVPLGGSALYALAGEFSILKWRGSIMSGYKGRKTIPTIHPAATFRGQYTYRYTIIHDLKRVRHEKDDPALNLPDRVFILDPSYEEACDFLTELKHEDHFATDIECFNHQVSCFSVCSDPYRIISIPFIDENRDHNYTELEEAMIWKLYAELMHNEKIMKIGQNIIFDIGFLFQKNNIITRGQIGDTMVAQHIVYPDYPKGLDFICSIHTREPYYKDDGKMWKKPWEKPLTFWRYNARDSGVSLEAWYELEKEMDQGGYRETHDFTVAMYPALTYMMSRGVAISQDALVGTKIKVKAKLETLYQELEDVGERTFNPLSPKQCQEYFYVTKGIKPYTNRKTGNVTTDDKAMARIVSRYRLPEAKLVQEIRGLNKLHGTYLDVAMDEDNRLRCSYNPRGTTTGRLSSSKTIFGTGLNMQNLHPEFKEFVVADD